MNGTGDQFLASSRFAQEQDRVIQGGRSIDLFDDRLQPQVPSHNRQDRCPGQFVFQHPVVFGQKVPHPLEFFEAHAVHEGQGQRFVQGRQQVHLFLVVAVVPVIGHPDNPRQPPEVLAKALEAAALETDQGNFVLLSREKAMLAEKLAGFMPDHLGCCYFSVVRGEAMEAACKLARGVTGRPNLVSVEGAWHGDTGFALSLSQHAQKHLFEPLIPAVDAIPFDDRAAEQL